MISRGKDLFARLAISAKKFKYKHVKYIPPKKTRIIVGNSNNKDVYLSDSSQPGPKSFDKKKEIAFLKIELHELEKNFKQLKKSHINKKIASKLDERINELKKTIKKKTV